MAVTRLTVYDQFEKENAWRLSHNQYIEVISIMGDFTASYRNNQFEIGIVRIFTKRGWDDSYIRFTGWSEHCITQSEFGRLIANRLWPTEDCKITWQQTGGVIRNGSGRETGMLEIRRDVNLLAMMSVS